MKNWKIGTRIAAGFAAVIAIAAALGLFALGRAREIGKRSDQLAGHYFPSTVALGVVRGDLHNALADLVLLVDSTDPARIAQLNEEIAALRAASKTKLEFYESAPFTPEEAKAYAEFKATQKDYWAAFEEVQTQGQSIDPAEIAKAQKLFWERMWPLQQKEAAVLDRLIALNAKEADAGMASIGGAVAASRRGILIGLTLAIALAMPIALAIVRGITAPLGQAVEALDAMAKGDLTVSLDVQTGDELGRMGRALNDALDKLRTTLREVAEAAAQSGSASIQLAGAAGAIASGAQQQAASLEETSASLERITATVRQTADNASQASDLGSGPRNLEGRPGALSAVSAMQDISAASAKIGAIISAVDEITFQTNLLAINAAIEAARAGEQGRGFAVVAAEVRSLAQRSAVAAKEIKGLIHDSLRKVEKGSDLVERVTGLVSDIAAATSQQSMGLEQVHTAVAQVDQIIQSNAAQTEELSSTAQTLADQADSLKQLVARFTLDRRQISRAGPPAPPTPFNSRQPVRPSAASSGRAASVALNISSTSSRNDRARPARREVVAAKTSSVQEEGSFQEF